MCGICGFLGEPTDIDRQAMLFALHHRGPDDTGEYEEKLPGGVLWFGHKRLSILDLSPAGHQPMSSPDGRYTITFNGEIYNFQEIKEELKKSGYHFLSRSDTEVILAAWDKWGCDAISRFRGMFAFGLWDRMEQCLWLVRDRLGEKPLYYLHQRNRVLFASEVRTLLASGIVERRLDADGLDSYLTFGSVAQPYSMVKDIKCLEAGCWLRYQNGSITRNPFWFLAEVGELEDRRRRQDLIPEVAGALLESFKLCMVADVPVALLLSGGVDSTSILALLTKNGYDNLGTFSIIFDADNQRYDEEYWSSRAAARFGSQHTRITVGLKEARAWIARAANCMDQPSIDGFNTFLVSQAIANQGLKVAIAGQGSDEQFLGYPSRDYLKVFLPLTKFSLPSWPIAAAHRLISLLGPSFSGFYRHGARLKNLLELFGPGNPYKLAYLAKYSVFNHIDLENLRGSKRPPQEGFVTLAGGGTPQGIWSRLELSNYLRNTLLRDGDQMSMACSLELRAPFCDHRLVELVTSLPIEQKVIPGRQKPLLVDAVNDELVTETARRTKMGFVLPIELWLRQGLLLSEPRGEPLGLSDAAVARVIRRFRQGQDFREYWTLAVLARWVEDQRLLPPLN